MELIEHIKAIADKEGWITLPKDEPRYKVALLVAGYKEPEVVKEEPKKKPKPLKKGKKK